MVRRRSKAQTSTSTITEALIYTRVSTGRQANDGVSLDEQIARTRDYISRQPNWVLGSEYTDVMSGSKSDRPGYQRLLADIRTMAAEGKRLAVVVLRLDRLGRRFQDRVNSREELKSLGVVTHSIAEGGEVNDLMANMLAVIAAQEADLISKRTTGVLAHIAQVGWYKIASLPFGYTSRDATSEERAAGAPRRTLQIDPQQALVVQECFRRVADGESVRSVARWMRSLSEVDRGGRVWAQYTVRRLLSCPTYIARHESADERVDPSSLPAGKWPAIISDDLWRAAQADMALGAKLPRRSYTTFLLSGFLRCARPECGERTTGDRSAERHARYRCRARQEYRCTGSMPAAAIERDVRAQLGKRLDVALTDDLMQELKAKWDALRGADTDAAYDQRVRELGLRTKIEECTSKLGKAARLLVEDIIDRAGYEALRRELEAEMDAASRKLERIEAPAAVMNELPPLNEVLALAGSWRAVLATDDVNSIRRVLAELVERIDPVRVKYGTYSLLITWTPLGAALCGIDRTVPVAA